MQNIILTGFGFMGTMHAQIYQQLKSARIAAVVEPRTNAARKSMRELGVDAPLYGKLSEALKKTDADIVDLCIPTDLHRRHALEAVRAGKHVFCEKPVALRSADAKAMGQAARKAGVKAQVGHCIRFWPEYAAFKRFLESGKAGALRSLNFQRRASLPGHSAGHWILDPARSGGAAIDLHVHDTDFILYLLGRPRSVRSTATFDNHGPSQIFTQYVYPDVSVNAECGWNYPPNWGFQMAFQAVFENGTVEYDSGASPTLSAVVGKGKRKALPFKEPSVGQSSTGAGNISALGGYFNELQSFIKRLDGGRDPETATLADAADSLDVVLAELRSAKSGKAVKTS